MRTDRIMAFLEAIKDNNNRPFFATHKAEYETAKADFEEIVETLIKEMRMADSTIEPLEVKDCTYRFYRDIRFSPDKSPYKRHFGTFIAPKGGKKSLLSGYYLHIEPGNSMIITGVYWLDKEPLCRMRDTIFTFYNEWQDLITAPAFKEAYGDVTTLEALKKMPRGYSEDFEGAKYLKMKNYVAMHSISDKEVDSPDFFQIVTETFKAGVPFSQFINETVTNGEM